MTVGPDLRVIDTNEAFDRIIGRTGWEAAGQSLTEALPGLGSDDIEAAFGVLEGRVEDFHFDRLHRDPDGHTTWLRITGSPSAPKGQDAPMLVIALEDVTSDHRDHDHLEHLATHDSLTGLVNRAFALEHLRRAGARSGRDGQHLAVLFIDLDGFKAINDHHGHGAGDAAIVEVAARITTSVRPSDTVARLSGDEFIVVCEGLGLDRAAARHEIVTIAERIIEEIARPLPALDPPMVVGASIGAVVAVGDALPVPRLLARADQAMYSAKAAGGNRCRLADVAASSGPA